MEFNKISEQQAWDKVAESTQAVRLGQVNKQLLQWLENQGINLMRAAFPCIRQFDEKVYSGTVIAGSRQAYEYFVDLDSPEEGELEDVTNQLGPKDPKHPKSDVKDLITMALLYFDNENANGG